MSILDNIPTTPNPTPSFTSAPISSGNKPGDFTALKWIIAGLIISLSILYFFSK
jgi:hypothetical protein